MTGSRPTGRRFFGEYRLESSQLSWLFSAGVGGFCVLPVFILQLAATFKVFFIDKIIEEVEEDEITVQPEMMAELTEAQANA